MEAQDFTETTPQGTSGDTNETTAVETTNEQGQSEQTTPDVLDLDSVEKFRYGGQEWTPKDLQGAILRQSDYTKKTQAIAEERKYYDNLSADLQAVKGNPELISKFKEVYPEKFHAYLEMLGLKEAAQETQGGLPPQYEDRLKSLESKIEEADIEKYNAELDQTLTPLKEKYPLADEESAIVRAEALLDKGVELNQKTWENIFKQLHDRVDGHYKSQQKNQYEQQRQANSEGRDVASGGGNPGRAPKIDSFEEASSLFEKQMKAARGL